MTDTGIKTEKPAAKLPDKPGKPDKIKFYIERGNPLIKCAVVLCALSMLFRVIGYWGFWSGGDGDGAYTNVFLPLLCCILFVVLIETLGKKALWTTSIPVFFAAVFLILETFGVKPWWIKALSILLYVVAACVYTVTVFGKIRSKWPLVVTIGAPLVYHLAVQDRTTLLNAADAAELVVWMPEISAMCFLIALLLTALAMTRFVPLTPGMVLPKIKGSKPVPPELSLEHTKKTQPDTPPAKPEVSPKEKPQETPEVLQQGEEENSQP